MSKGKYPICSGCGRTFQPGATWPKANFCRGLLLLYAIGENPGLSTAELGILTGLSYHDAMSGMNRLRGMDAVIAVEEERAAGGIRYRYSPNEDHEAQLVQVDKKAHEVGGPRLEPILFGSAH